MLKKITYALIIMMFALTSLALAANKEEIDPNWAPLDLGPAVQGDYFFNTATLKFGRLPNGEINKNIVIYQEKHVNNNISSVQYKFYSITEGKINVENKAIMLGDETFYTRKGKVRWVDAPQYKVWVDITPKTLGDMRYQQIVEYMKAHEAEISQR